jgi:TrmH family RNA methyltransferase
MSPLCTSVRLPPAAASHQAVRRYLLARRCALPRGELVVPVAGLWAHRQLLRLEATVEAFLWCPGAAESSYEPVLADVVEALVARAEASYVISERTLARLQPGAGAPGLLSLVRLPAWRPRDVFGRVGRRLVLVADGIEYAGNLGTLVRTVDACGAAGLVLSGPMARLTHPTVFTASRGTVVTTPVLVCGDAGAARRVVESEGFRILVADPDVACDYRIVQYDDRPTAIVVGSEGHGVSDAWRGGAAEPVAIPMRGRADSLNVAAAAAILLFSAV